MKQLTMNNFKPTQASLKNLAMVLMLINHLGDAICTAYSITGFWYNFCWFISRPAFIIYAFFIAEGLRRTSSRKKYLLRLGLFALISEIPFDLCFSGKAFDLASNNVFITLFLGALAISIMEKTEFKGEKIIILIIGAFAADFLMSDYGLMGVAIIYAFYFLKENKKAMFLSAAGIMIAYIVLAYLGYLIEDFPKYFTAVLNSVLLQLHACLAFPLLASYQGEKGNPLPKWIYYVFYPLHLLLIWFFLVR